MKKVICMMAAASMILASVAGCSNEGGSDNSSTTTPSAAVSDAAVSTGTEAAADTSEAEGGETDAPENGGEETEGTVGKIAEKIIEAYGENYLPNMDIPEEMLKDNIGLDPDSYTEIFAQQPMISAHPDTIIIAKAASGKTDEVKSALEKYQDMLINDSFQYPMNVAKVNSSKIVANGDYVAFIMLGAINENEDSSEEEQAAFAEAQTAIGVDAFNAYFG